MTDYILSKKAMGTENIDKVGGKGAHLGSLSNVRGIRVPTFFCITTDAYLRSIAPLLPAEDAIIIDTSTYGIEQVVEEILIKIGEKGNPA